MNYIELESVGSLVTNEGLVFPIDCSEAPVTASDADEMMGVNVFECDDENTKWASDMYHIAGTYNELSMEAV